MSRQAIALPTFAFGMSKKSWIILGVVFWLYFVISHIPAVWGAWMLTRSGDVAMSGVTGTVWSGRASLTSVKFKNVNYSLGQVTWKLKIFSLLLLKPCAHITSTADNQTFEGDVCSGFGNRLSMSDVTANFPAMMVQPLLPIGIEGQLSLQMEDLDVQNNQLSDLKAKVTWENAKIYNGTNWMELGGFGADLSDDDKKGLRAHIVDANSPVRVDVNAALLSPSGGSIKGSLTISEGFLHQTNSQAWLSMFAVPQPTDAQGNINYAVDLNL
ncbi:MAG: type II secretion system protein N [Moraxellaceae bacterium]|nr:MAG: type II secretion system protein N [Moraxellaceae bacterium]